MTMPERLNVESQVQAIVESPLILHCHVPKTAGTTVSAGFRRSFSLFHLHHFHSDPLYVLTSEILENLLDINPLLASISSHNLRSFPRRIRGRSTFFVTFLRRPEDAFISQLRFAQRNFARLPREVQTFLPRQTPQLPLRELAIEYLNLVASEQDFCPQTRFFCHSVAMAKFGLTDGNQYGFNSYEIARLILSEFDFVGIVEEMKKSLELLTDCAAQAGIRLSFQLSGKENCSAEQNPPEWLTPEDDVGSRILNCNTSDSLLYSEFRTKLLEEHRELRRRRWLGFRPALTDVFEEFRAANVGRVRQSLANSWHLFRSRHSEPPANGQVRASENDLCPLEEWAALTVLKTRDFEKADPTRSTDQKSTTITHSTSPGKFTYL
jgi:hypothetical protein